LKGSVKEPNKFHNNETEKITRKASDVQNISSSLVLPPEIVMHNAMLFSGCPSIYASSCTTISGGRTEQHVIIRFGELAAVD